MELVKIEVKDVRQSVAAREVYTSTMMSESAGCGPIAIERDKAILTKAYISDKKTAAAMNTASRLSKENHRLEIELDKSKEYSTIKRMELITGLKFNWKILKSACIELGIEPIEVFDNNYGAVKSYHKDVWLEAYALDID